LQPLSKRELADLQFGKPFDIRRGQAVLLGNEDRQQLLLHAGKLFQQYS